MTTQNKTFNFSITAPGGGGSLEAAFAGLSANQWSTFTIGNSFNPDPTGVGDTMMSYTQRAVYDPTRKVIHFVGGTHGGATSANRHFLATYVLSTNQWLTPVVVPGGSQTFEHTYYNAAVDSVTGYVYVRHAFSDLGNLHVFDHVNRTWIANVAGPGFGTNYGISLQYHIARDRLMWGHYWGVSERASGGSWSSITTANRIGDQGPVAAYSPKDSCVYMGGGGGSGAGQLWKINSAGVMTACAYPGVTLGVWDAGSGGSTSALFGSGNPANRLFCIAKDRSIREYDEVGNSWSGVIDTAPAGLSPGVNPGGDWIMCQVNNANANESGMIGFKLSSMTAVSTTAHIWKR